MTPHDFDALAVGDPLPELLLPPIDRSTLALFAGASGDHNPIHIDIDFARRAGMPDVFAHGMLSMAWLGRLLTRWVPQASLRSFGVRFLGIAHLGDAIRCTGRVAEKLERDGERLLRVELAAVNQYGERKVLGEALIALPPPASSGRRAGRKRNPAAKSIAGR
jgi:acyl dehydratase